MVEEHLKRSAEGEVELFDDPDGVFPFESDNEGITSR